jgi:folate-binding protein YgfZ
MTTPPTVAAATTWTRVPRDVVEVRGPDAIGFLQGQCSQDLAGLAVGASAWSFVLQPVGKLDVVVRATRIADDAMLLDTEAGQGPALLARLRRFKLRVKLDLVDHEGWSAVMVRGPQAATVAAGLGGRVVVGWWGSLAEPDVIGAPGTVADPPGDPVDHTTGRVRAGWPLFGAELTTDTIPGESGLVPVAVSFRKGCYTGQELVARVDSRGNNVPRRVCRLVGDGPLAVGPLLGSDGTEVGRVTSVAGPAGLGVVGRAVPVGATLEQHDAFGPVTVTVLDQRDQPEAAAAGSSPG